MKTHILAAILIFILIVLLTGCQPVFVFEPIQLDYLKKISFDSVKIEYNSFKVIGGVNGILKISLNIINNHEAKVQFMDNIKINGNYYETYKIDHIAYKDLSVENSITIYDNDEPFEIYGAKSNIIIICFLNKKEKDIEFFANIVKKEKFKVQLPSLLINGKEYNFKELDFICK